MILTVTFNPAIDRVIEVNNFYPGKTLKGRLIGEYCGGKGINVAKVLSFFKIKCGATGFIGKREFPTFAELLSELHIENFMISIKEKTRISTTIIDPVNSTETHLRELGPNVTPEDIERLREAIKNITSLDLVVISGSIPQGMTYEDVSEFLKFLNEKNTKIVMDTSPEIISYVLSKGINVFLIKPNLEEFGFLVRRNLDGEKNIREYVEKFSKEYNINILLSMGKDGIFYKDTSCKLWQGVYKNKITPVNTVGSGDSLLGGFIVGMINKKDIKESLTIAIASATANVLSQCPGEIDYDTYKDILENIEVREVI